MSVTVIPTFTEVNEACVRAEDKIREALGELMISVAAHANGHYSNIDVRVKPTMSLQRDEKGLILAVGVDRVAVDIFMHEDAPASKLGGPDMGKAVPLPSRSGFSREHKAKVLNLWPGAKCKKRGKGKHRHFAIYQHEGSKVQLGSGVNPPMAWKNAAEGLLIRIES